MIMIYNALCAHFHLRPSHVAEDFLPQPDVPRLEMDVGGRSDEELLTRAVERIYSIKRDDENLRRIIRQPPDKRGRYFDDLRKHYPVRRELQNTTVVLDQPKNSLLQKIRGVGFQVPRQG